jgi:hypothetical protein
LREWAQDLLSPARLQRTGLDPAPMQKIWHTHLASDAQVTGLEPAIWSALMYQAWLARHA